MKLIIFKLICILKKEPYRYERYFLGRLGKGLL